MGRQKVLENNVLLTYGENRQQVFICLEGIRYDVFVYFSTGLKLVLN